MIRSRDLSLSIEYRGGREEGVEMVGHRQAACTTRYGALTCVVPNWIPPPLSFPSLPCFPPHPFPWLCFPSLLPSPSLPLALPPFRSRMQPGGDQAARDTVSSSDIQETQVSVRRVVGRLSGLVLRVRARGGAGEEKDDVLTHLVWMALSGPLICLAGWTSLRRTASRVVPRITSARQREVLPELGPAAIGHS